MISPVHKAAFHESPFPGVILERRAPGEFYILDVNSAARMSGEWSRVREEDVIGRNITDVFPGGLGSRQLDAYEQAFADQEIVDLGEGAFEDAEVPSGVTSVRVVPLDESWLLITARRSRQEPGS